MLNFMTTFVIKDSKLLKLHITNTFENKERLFPFSKSFDDEITMLHVSHLLLNVGCPLGQELRKMMFPCSVANFKDFLTQQKNWNTM